MAPPAQPSSGGARSILVTALLLGLVASGGLVTFSRTKLARTKRTKIDGLKYIESSPNEAASTRFEIQSPATGTSGKYLRFQLLARPTTVGYYAGKPGSVPLHSHKESETVTVVEGEIHGLVGGKHIERKAGESIELLPHVPHTFWTASNSDIVLKLEVRPAGVIEAFVTNLAGLGFDAGGIEKVNPLQLILTFRESGIVLEDVPAPLRPLVDLVLVPAAKALGFRGFYPEYCIGGKVPAKAGAGKEEL